MSMMRKAELKDIEHVSALYNTLNTFLAAGTNTAGLGWQLGVYPTEENATRALAAESLFVFLVDNSVAGTMILDSNQDPNYEQVAWMFPAPASELLVIHTLAVHPDFRGQKIGQTLVQAAIDYGRENGYQAIRLDTWTGNLPANKLYEQIGFQLRGSGKLSLERLAERDFNFYEYAL